MTMEFTPTNAPYCVDLVIIRDGRVKEEWSFPSLTLAVAKFDRMSVRRGQEVIMHDRDGLYIGSMRGL